jgi:hypothetical protein
MASSGVPTSPTSPPSHIPTSPKPSSSRIPRIPFPELKSKVQLAINARNECYVSVAALILYWEKDNTGAKEDADHLESTFQKFLNITATKVMIPNNHYDHDRFVQIEMGKMRDREFDPIAPARCLFIMAYIGHGEQGDAGGVSELRLCQDLTGGKSVSWQELQRDIREPFIDFLGILDCCAAEFRPTRNTNPRSIQVLAACGPTEEARTRNSRITFTQRLCGELKREAQFKKSSITVDALFDNLRTNISPNTARPQLLTYGGVKPIVLNLRLGTDPSTSHIPRSRPPLQSLHHHLLAKLTLGGQGAGTVREFEQLILTLPAEYKVVLVDAYKTTDSVLILARMSWSTWARLSRVIDIKPIEDIIGNSLVSTSTGAVP